MIVVKLSRRNLLCLLHKLEMPGSARIIVKQSEDDDVQGEPRREVYINAVTDEELYVGRDPGPMHPLTEAFAADLEAALKIVRDTKRNEIMCNFFASSKRPELISYNGDLLAGIDKLREQSMADLIGQEDRPPSNIPDSEEWPAEVAKVFGFNVTDKFPIYWDGGGCYILKRDKVPDSIPGDHPLRGVMYLAILNVTSENDINVGIRDEAALLQFYRLVEPMLRLKGDKQYRNGKKEEGYWNNGKEWAELHADRMTAFRGEQARKASQ